MSNKYKYLTVKDYPGNWFKYYFYDVSYKYLDLPPLYVTCVETGSRWPKEQPQDRYPDDNEPLD